MGRRLKSEEAVRNVANDLLDACKAVLAAAKSRYGITKAMALTDAVEQCQAAVEKTKLPKQRQAEQQTRLTDVRDYGLPMAYAYLRVSHEDSRSSGLSPAAQLDICRTYYERHLRQEGVVWYGLTEIPLELNLKEYDPNLLLFYDPAVSARRVPFLDRKAGAALHAILKPGDHVIFAHLDRAVRAVLDHAQLIEVWRVKRITIHHADMNVDLSTPHGQLVANIMAAVAQAQSDFISQRTREALAERASRNNGKANRGGSPPRGWKYFRHRSGRLQLVPDTKVLRIYNLFCYLYEVENRTWIEAAEIIERKVRKEAGRKNWETLPKENQRKWPPKKLFWLYQRMKWDRGEPKKTELRRQKQQVQQEAGD
jgi:DNA invertase Pin-like site-specific DNA recombinase